MALVVPPSFVDVSRHQPRRVQLYSSLITEASGQDLLSRRRFLLAALGFYSRLVDIQAFQQLPALWLQLRTVTRPFKAFTYSVVAMLFLRNEG